MRVFDSNILIYHLNDALPSAARDRVERWIVAGAAISVITRIEVLGYPQPEASQQQAAHLLTLFDEVALHEDVVRRTIALRQRLRIRTPDAIIAATAMSQNAPLVTRNHRDFSRIDGLDVQNPFD